MYRGKDPKNYKIEFLSSSFNRVELMHIFLEINSEERSYTQNDTRKQKQNIS